MVTSKAVNENNTITASILNMIKLKIFLKQKKML